MTGITGNLAAVRQRMEAAAARFGRATEDITLVAVAKRHPAEAIRALAAAGQRHFAESYAQEAQSKLATLDDLDVTWHFIGALQRNKTAFVAERFDWVHSLDRSVIADRLAAQRPADRPPLQVCLQVDFTGNEGRAGVPPDALLPLAEHVAGLEGLALRGLMTLPPQETDFERQREHFRRLAGCLAQLRQHGLAVDVMSAGMSDDLEAAIAEGATHVRIGTALFGPRDRA